MVITVFIHSIKRVRIIRSYEKELCGIRRGGKSTTRVSEETKMASERRSGVYQAILSGRGLSSMVKGGRLKTGIPQ